MGPAPSVLIAVAAQEVKGVPHQVLIEYALHRVKQVVAHLRLETAGHIKCASVVGLGHAEQLEGAGAWPARLHSQSRATHQHKLAVGDPHQRVHELEAHERTVGVHEAYVALGVLLNVDLHEDDVQVLGLAEPVQSHAGQQQDVSKGANRSFASKSNLNLEEGLSKQCPLTPGCALSLVCVLHGQEQRR